MLAQAFEILRELRSDETARYLSFLLGTLALVFVVRLGMRLIPARAVGLVPAGRQLSELWLYVICALAFACLLIIAHDVLQRFPYLGDEDAYVFQAKTLLAGRLWNPAHPLPEFFTEFRVVQKAGKWVGQYPPGWPAVLALGSLAGLPFWAVGSTIGVLLLLCFVRLARMSVSRNWVIGGVLALATSPYFLFTSASFMSHAVVATAGLAFAYYARRFLANAAWRDGVFVGVALGFVGLSRSGSAVLFALPLVAAIGLQFSWHYIWRSASIILGGLPFLAALLWYQHQITGDALLPVVNWIYPGTEPIGVVNSRTLGLGFTSIREFGEWTSPLLLLAYFSAVIYKIMYNDIKLDNWCFLVFMIAFLFYNSFGVGLFGPRYYFDAYPLCILTVFEALPGIAKRILLRPYVLAGILVHIVIQLALMTSQVPDIRKIYTEFQDIFIQVKKNDIKNSIVFVRSGTGTVKLLLPRDLVRNEISGEGTVLYARDRGEDNARLFDYYPSRHFYIYEREARSPTGRLVAVDRASP